MSVYNLISQAAVDDIPSDTEILNSLGLCRNTTVGENKYQLYCVSRTNLVGSCVSLPSKYTSGGINCMTVTSQAFLQQLYRETGNACAIYCYYPISIPIPNISIPPINIPTFTFPTLNFPSLTPAPTATTTRAFITTTTTQGPAATSNPNDGDNDLDLPDADLLPPTNSTTAASGTPHLSSPNTLLNLTIFLFLAWMLIRKFGTN